MPVSILWCGLIELSLCSDAKCLKQPCLLQWFTFSHFTFVDLKLAIPTQQIGGLNCLHNYPHVTIRPRQHHYLVTTSAHSACFLKINNTVSWRFMLVFCNRCRRHSFSLLIGLDAASLFGWAPFCCFPLFLSHFVTLTLCRVKRDAKVIQQNAFFIDQKHRIHRYLK